jgi:hypothetical protein
MKTAVQGMDMALMIIFGISGFVITFITPLLGWLLIALAGLLALNYYALDEKS